MDDSVLKQHLKVKQLKKHGLQGGQAMATNTAKGAEKKDTRTITFKNKDHRDFYKEYLQKCRCQDVYHKVLV